MAEWKHEYRDLFLPRALEPISGFYQSLTDFMKIDWHDFPPKTRIFLTWYEDQRGVE